MKAKSSPARSPAKPAVTRRQRKSPARSTPKSFPVVGIGASAGGFESFTQFLELLPLDVGMAFVLVQHLNPTHESKLSELLSRTTPLPVIEVKHSVKVEPNHVYVIPPNKNLVIKNGWLELSPRRMAELPPMPVDYFLRSLAEDQGHNAIGIIFSGNGSDGTLGMEAIKGADGLTFAQEPKTAKYNSMPASAIASGCVDFVQSPQQMAKELAQLHRHPETDGRKQKHVDETTTEPRPLMAKIYSHLHAASGVDFALYKQTTLKRRITRRMIVHRIGKLEDYVRLLQKDPEEVSALFEDVLITVTRFFRDPKSLRMLVKKVFPALLRGRKRGMPIRIWVPGCSSGEEVYSLAIALMEFLGNRLSEHPVQIFGTDINEAAIAKARAGIYRANIAMDVTPERLRRFFTSVDDSYRIHKSVRDMCVFARQNLCGDPPFSKIDLISCQNVLIYFDGELQRQVMSVFHYALQPSGFLLLSSAESIGGLTELFTAADRKHRLYRKASTTPQREVKFNSRVFTDEAAPAPATEPAAQEALLPNIEKAADRVLLHHCVPAGVVIDGKMQVVQFRGFTAPYLEHTPGAASLNLLKMVCQELVVPLRASINRALKQQGPVNKEVSWTKSGSRARLLKLRILPFKSPPSRDQFLLVMFEEGRAWEVGPKSGTTGKRKSGKSARSAAETETVRLQQELETVRASYQTATEEQEATNEELKSASEEIQSSNEELQSTNEELETAKEELQSTNEELATINEELQQANLEANRFNNDLINLLASIQIPLLMVDNHLTIRRFTPSAQKFFNLIPTDLGRSLTDIKTALDVVDLDRLILEVIDTLHLKECQTRDRDGHWYQLRIRPYRTKENKIDGAVIALVDIDEMKRSLEQIGEIMWEPFVALDAEMRVIKASGAFYEKFQVRPGDTEGKFIHLLGNGQWNIPRLRTLLDEVLPQQKQIRDFRVDANFPGIGPREMLLNARQLENPDEGKKMILLAFNDITKEKNP